MGWTRAIDRQESVGLRSREGRTNLTRRERQQRVAGPLAQLNEFGAVGMISPLAAGDSDANFHARGILRAGLVEAYDDAREGVWSLGRGTP